MDINSGNYVVTGSSRHTILSTHKAASAYAPGDKTSSKTSPQRTGPQFIMGNLRIYE